PVRPRTRVVRVTDPCDADELLEAVRQTERAERASPRIAPLVTEPPALAPVPEPVAPVPEPVVVEVVPVAPEPARDGRLQHADPGRGFGGDRRDRLGPALERRGPQRRRVPRRGVPPG